MTFLENANYDWMDLLDFQKRPFRAKFVPAKVWNDLDRYKNDDVGLSNYVKKWRTRVVWSREKSKSKFYKANVSVGGEYDPEIRQCVLEIYTHRFNKFYFTKKSWRKFKFKLIQAQMHELIHFMQYDKRSDEWSNYVVPYKKIGHPRKDAERKYLSEFDEIQAYANCILLDYKFYKPKVAVSDLLARSKCKLKRDSNTFQYILKTFDYDGRNNHAIKKIIKQVGRWEKKYEKTIRASKRPK